MTISVMARGYHYQCHEKGYHYQCHGEGSSLSVSWGGAITISVMERGYDYQCHGEGLSLWKYVIYIRRDDRGKFTKITVIFLGFLQFSIRIWNPVPVDRDQHLSIL